MILYSQRDPRWSSHPLGWGPALGTIGAYGCFDSVLAMIATACGYILNPAQLDQALTAAKLFVRDPSGTYDLLPDNALAQLFPTAFQVSSYAGLRGDLVAAALPSKDTYAVLWISTAAVPTHFVLAYSVGPNWYIADPWTGAVGRLGGYGGPGAVHKTILVRHLPPPSTPTPPPHPAPVQLPAQVNPPIVSPPPLPPPTPPGGTTPVASNPTPAPAPTPVPLPSEPIPIPVPDLPEPPPVAEAGVTTSEWKVLIGYVIQGAATATGLLVFKATGVHLDPTVLQIVGGAEVGLTLIGTTYIASRGIRKLGTTA